jgi:hypothetical protein
MWTANVATFVQSDATSDVYSFQSSYCHCLVSVLSKMIDNAMPSAWSSIVLFQRESNGELVAAQGVVYVHMILLITLEDRIKRQRSFYSL